MTLDFDYPIGNPAALFCRHCQKRRAEVNGGLFCRTCDGAAFATAEGNRHD